MKIYEVGGCVRDRLMGVEPKDIDYVVVGARPSDMIAMGMTQVGADFPVFLDSNGDEYALARRERKTGTGYLGFTSEFTPDVTLEEDLGRRDLTINSMARDIETGEIIDPFGGQDDVKRKFLRHTSNAFMEDPVRVLRLARFMCRLGDGWNVSSATMRMVYQMGQDGVLDELDRDRVWKEFSRAMMEDKPHLFFHILECADVFDKVFPDLKGYRVDGLRRAVEMDQRLGVRMAIILRDLPLTGKQMQTTMRHMRVPSDMKDVILLGHSYIEELRGDVSAERLVSIMKQARNRRNFMAVVTAAYCVDHPMPNAYGEFLKRSFAWKASESVKFSDVFPNGEYNGQLIANGMFNAKVAAVKKQMEGRQ